jgi:hypothetical protein
MAGQLDGVQALCDDEILARCWEAVLQREKAPERNLRAFQRNDLMDCARAWSRDDERAEGVVGEMVARGLIYSVNPGTAFRAIPSAKRLSPEDVRRGWPPEHVDLARFPQVATWEPTLLTYFRLAVRTHAANVPEAALFFLGGASERLVDLVAEKMTSLDRGKWKKCTKVGAKIELLIDTLRGCAKRQQRPELLGVADLLGVIGHGYRLGRNDVGHPAAVPPQVSRATVAARLHEFPDYVEQILAAAGSC